MFTRIFSLLVIGQLLFLHTDRIDGSKILGYLVTPSRSHFIIHDSLMRGLAAKGHQVTVVSLFPAPKETPPNYRYIQLEMSDTTKAIWAQMTGGLLDSADKEEVFFMRLPTLLQSIAAISAETYHSPQVQRLKRTESFDLVAYGWFFNDYHIGIAAHFKCPAVIISSAPQIKLLRDYVGNPSAVANVPSLFTSYREPMTFKDRLMNYVISAAEGLASEWATRFVLQPVYDREFPASAAYPTFAEAKKNVSLVFVTSHFSQNAPFPSFPGLIEVSGMHIPRAPKPLPKNIENWLETAKHGVIYFSMGSNIKSTQITSERREAMLRVFSRLKERVLWKWEDEQLPGRPDNVMIQNWLPQSDILAHPNVKLFISHCGKGSLNEARYNGVPVLGVPVFADQPGNLASIVDEGWAVPLQYADLTEQTFEQALHEALTNRSYGDIVRGAAKLFVDRPQHPLDTAVYWVEYVLRHKGAKHMQSQAVNQNWIVYHSLDVLGLIAAIAWISWKLSVLLVRTLWNLCRNSSKSDKKTKKTKKSN